MSQSSLNTYLVTGAAGFIGSQFVRSCPKSEVNLISVDARKHFTERTEHRDVHFGEIVDRTELWDYLSNQNGKNPHHIDAIIHLGAITDTREMDRDRLNTLNLEYSKRLWKYATEHQIPFIYASSAATYGDGNQGYDDDETQIPELRPLNPYGESKQNFDLWALENERNGLHPPQWSGYKFFNVFGYGERHKGFMSSVVLHGYDQVLKSGQITLFKSHREGIPDGHQKRDFIYVDDVVRVLHFALNKPIKRGIYNLGTGQARPFLDLAKAVFKALGKPENIQFVETPIAIRDKYQYFTQASMQKLKAQGYTWPFVSLEEGVADYIGKLTRS